MPDLEKTCRVCGRPRPASEDFCPYCTAPSPSRPIRKRSTHATVDTGLETRWGGGEWNPTVEEMRAALAELDTPDEEHPDAWLGDQDGWAVAIYESGLLIFSGPEGEISRRRGVSRDQALELWLLLQQGRRDEIRQKLSA